MGDSKLDVTMYCVDVINKLVEVVIAGRDDEKYLYHLNTCDKSEVLFYRLCLESFVIVLSAHVSQLTQVPDS